MDNNNKPRRGRPKGGVSFVRVNIDTLKDYCGIKQTIPVSRVWLEENGIITKTNNTNDGFKWKY